MTSTAKSIKIQPGDVVRIKHSLKESNFKIAKRFAGKDVTVIKVAHQGDSFRIEEHPDAVWSVNVIEEIMCKCTSFVSGDIKSLFG